MIIFFKSLPPFSVILLNSVLVCFSLNCNNLSKNVLTLLKKKKKKNEM
jgi:hypothetical protein